MRTRLLLVALPLLAGCASGPATKVSTPHWPNLGPTHREIATTVPEAQRYFDQGLVFCYGFNHDEAVRAFQAAQSLDPSCAMAFWGEAFALGPNINAPLEDPKIAERAHQAAQKALALRDREKGANQALIDAIVTRYATPAPKDRKPLDRAFADAMRKAQRAFPQDPDVGALTAESLLDLNPWETWHKNGEPKENTLEVVSLLEGVLKRHPDHILAIHLYIHAVEASPSPERAAPHADRLGALAPAAGHLVHMPAHIYINIARYRDAEEVNRKAVAVDRAYLNEVGMQGMYEFYRAHNHHFLVYAAMFQGRRAVAVGSARDLLSDIPAQWKENMAPAVDGFMPVPWHAMIRFGMWKEMLEEPMPEGPYPIAKTLYHYARGVALAATGKVDEAVKEQAAFEAAAKHVAPDAKIGINPAPPVIVVARHMLAGELLYRQGKHAEAFAELRTAAESEDGLRYDEPSPWMQPVRHALGALLLEQGKVEEAEAVYRADLAKHKENGWSLHGLAECLRRSGKADEAKAVEQRFATAWKDADVQLKASCFCRTIVASAAGACCDAEPRAGN
jgi:tetratricopeptide (TPR) repeat protein